MSGIIIVQICTQWLHEVTREPVTASRFIGCHNQSELYLRARDQSCLSENSRLRILDASFCDCKSSLHCANDPPTPPLRADISLWDLWDFLHRQNFVRLLLLERGARRCPNRLLASTRPHTHALSPDPSHLNCVMLHPPHHIHPPLTRSPQVLTTYQSLQNQLRHFSLFWLYGFGMLSLCFNNFVRCRHTVCVCRFLCVVVFFELKMLV